MYDSPELNKCAGCGYDRPGMHVTEERNGVVTVRAFCLECALKLGEPVHDWAIRSEQAEKAARKSN
jgi:hypothetical protein